MSPTAGDDERFVESGLGVRRDPGLIVRPMLTSELKPVRCLLTDCYRWLAEQERWGDEALKEILQVRASIETIQAEAHSQRWLVATIAEQTVGVVAVDRDEIARLYVDPAHHRMGIGAKLFKAALELISEAGHGEAMLGSNESALPFYQAMGMRVTDRRAYGLFGFGGHTVYLMAGPTSGQPDH